MAGLHPPLLPVAGDLSKVDRYRDILRQALEARAAGDESLEESLMAKLDSIWRSMTAAEVEQTELISRELVISASVCGDQ